MKFPLYFVKPIEELARALVFALGTYLVMAVQTQGVPNGQQAVVVLISGAVPIVYATVRQPVA